jgi:D-lyxose ketol-isomerase
MQFSAFYINSDNAKSQIFLNPGDKICPPCLERVQVDSAGKNNVLLVRVSDLVNDAFDNKLITVRRRRIG